MNHLLVTNDFPPKVGGIQSYLHELWRRLPPEGTTVLTSAHPDAAAWDAEQPFRIERIDRSFMAPTPSLVRQIDDLAAATDSSLVLLDPAWPLGAIGPRLTRPYGVVVHGAEVAVPARLPVVQLMLRKTLRDARLVVAAGSYPAREAYVAAGRRVPTVNIPPGVDTTRFCPLDPSQRTEVRESFGIEPEAFVILGVSRLVTRKGFDLLLQAVTRMVDEFPEVHVVIAGEGRDRGRLEGLATALSAPVTFLGPVSEDRLPGLYASADLFAMICRDRWLGLEQEGFGIVFLEAAAAGVASVAGLSGGSADAVIDGVTGYVVEHPTSIDDIEDAIGGLLDAPDQRRAFGATARRRAVDHFDYDRLAAQLAAAIEKAIEDLPQLVADDGRRPDPTVHPDPAAGNTGVATTPAGVESLTGSPD